MALLENAIGSTIALVNGSGSLATQYGYEPFGKTAQSGSSTTNPYAFAGREQDPSGLYFMRARYYNQVLGSFGGRLRTAARARLAAASSRKTRSASPAAR